MTALTDIERLRMYVGERILAGGTAADTFFSDDELQDLIDSSPAGVNGAAVLGWSIKAAEYARLIDLNESGAERKLSQRYRQALNMLQYYTEQADKDVAQGNLGKRVVGKPIDWASRCSSVQVLYTTGHRFRSLA